MAAHRAPRHGMSQNRQKDRRRKEAKPRTACEVGQPSRHPPSQQATPPRMPCCPGAPPSRNAGAQSRCCRDPGSTSSSEPCVPSTLAAA
eukprot:6798517-Alexandrium_andersonii.AAC.1